LHRKKGSESALLRAKRYFNTLTECAGFYWFFSQSYWRNRALAVDDPPMVKKVLVVYIDPVIEPERRRHLSEVLNWNDPGELNRDYLKLLNKVSGGTVKWEEFASVELDGKVKKVSSRTWGGSDFQLNNITWWLERLPNIPGRYVDDENPVNDGKLNNWWKYIVDMNEYPESR